MLLPKLCTDAHLLNNNGTNLQRHLSLNPGRTQPDKGSLRVLEPIRLSKTNALYIFNGKLITSTRLLPYH